jgi:AAA domain
MSATTNLPANTSLFIESPASAERLESLFQALAEVVVIRPEKSNWIDELRDFDDYNATETKWIQPGLIEEGSSTVIVARTGHGKSLLGLKLAQAFTTAAELFGHQHPEPRAVLYLDKENKPSALRKRRDWFKVAIRGKKNPDSLLYYSSLYLTGKRDVDDRHILDWAERQSPAPVIIVDTLLRHLMKGQKENNADDISDWFRLFDKLLKLGCAVVILHHTGKGETTQHGRGSLDIEGATDYMFKLENVTPGANGKPDSSLPISVVSIDRIKGRIPCELWDQKVFVHIGKDGSFSVGEKPTKSKSAALDETATVADSDKLMAIVEANPGVLVATFEVMAKDQGIGQGVSRKWRQASTKDGSIVKWLGARNAIHLYPPGQAPAVRTVSSEGLLPSTEAS